MWLFSAWELSDHKYWVLGWISEIIDFFNKLLLSCQAKQKLLIIILRPCQVGTEGSPQQHALSSAVIYMYLGSPSGHRLTNQKPVEATPHVRLKPGRDGGFSKGLVHHSWLRLLLLQTQMCNTQAHTRRAKLIKTGTQWWWQQEGGNAEQYEQAQTIAASSSLALHDRGDGTTSRTVLNCRLPHVFTKHFTCAKFRPYSHYRSTVLTGYFYVHSTEEDTKKEGEKVIDLSQLIKLVNVWVRTRIKKTWLLNPFLFALYCAVPSHPLSINKFVPQFQSIKSCL